MLEAMTVLLNEAMEPSFLDQSHGLRRGRGAKTFFRALSDWPDMDSIIKCDVRNCFSSIGHDILLKTLIDHLGQVNMSFIGLIEGFLKSDIFDRKGKNYACSEVGIPQGSPISPTLMNVFLHLLDQSFSLLAVRSQRIHYLRYADDMVFGNPIAPEGIDPLKQKDTLGTFVSKELQRFELEHSWVAYLRPKPFRSQSPLEILGLLVSLSPTGSIRIDIPMKKWAHRLTYQKVWAQMKAQGLPHNLHSFLSVMNEHVESYIRYALQYPLTTDKIKKKLVRFFHNLFLHRSSQFIQDTKCEESGVENKSMDRSGAQRRISPITFRTR